MPSKTTLESVPLHLPLFEIILTFYSALDFDDQEHLIIIIFVLMHVSAAPRRCSMRKGVLTSGDGS
jgi:hypothetical protein